MCFHLGQNQVRTLSSLLASKLVDWYVSFFFWDFGIYGNGPLLLGWSATWGSSPHLTDLDLDEFQLAFNWWLT